MSDIEALLRRATAARAGTGAGLDACSACCCIECDRPAEAIACYQRAIELDPAMPSAWAGLGADYAQIGDMEKSVDAYARSVALQPDVARRPHELRACAESAGTTRRKRCASIATAIAQKPDFGEVYWSMANLKVFRFETEEVAAMEEQVSATDLSESADVHFRFALGKAYEDKGDYERAWELLRHGQSAAAEAVCPTIRSGIEVRHEEIVEVFSREFLESARGRRDSSPDAHLHRRAAALRARR